MRFSPSEIVGNSSGSPPACRTPRLTASASPRKWRLQLTSSDQELQMPITGRPSSAAREMPSACSEARWMKPARSWAPNQRALRRDCVPLVPSPRSSAPAIHPWGEAERSPVAAAPATADGYLGRHDQADRPEPCPDTCRRQRGRGRGGRAYALASELLRQRARAAGRVRRRGRRRPRRGRGTAQCRTRLSRSPP